MTTATTIAPEEAAATITQVNRSAYIIQQRTQANITGKPILRSTTPSVVSPALSVVPRFQDVIKAVRPDTANPLELETLMIVSIDEGQLLAQNTATGSIEKVTYALMDSWSEVNQIPDGKPVKQGQLPTTRPVRRFIVMFADSLAQRAMAKLARKNPSNAETRLDRVMEVSASLPMSQLFPVLTRALTLRYYLPASLDTNLIDDWMTAFGIAAMRRQDALAILAFQSIRSKTEGGLPSTALLELSRSETYLTKSASFRSTTSDIRSFRSITGITDQWNHLREIDGALIPENVAGSAVFAGTLTAMPDSPIADLIRMDAPPKVKAGDRVIVVSDTGVPLGTREVEVIRLEEDSIIIRLTKGVPQARGRVILAKEPFRGGSKTPFASPWSGGKFSPTEGMVERNISVDLPQRSVPLDILVAGQH